MFLHVSLLCLFFLIQKIILISFFGLMINQQHLVFLLRDAREKGVFDVFSLRCLPIISRSNKNSAVNNAARCIHEEAPAVLLLFSILSVHVCFSRQCCVISVNTEVVVCIEKEVVLLAWRGKSLFLTEPDVQKYNVHTLSEVALSRPIQILIFSDQREILFTQPLSLLLKSFDEGKY